MGRKKENPNSRQRQVYFKDNPADDQAFKVLRELETSGYAFHELAKAMLHALDAGTLRIEEHPLRIVPAQRNRVQDMQPIELVQAIVEGLSGPFAQNFGGAVAKALTNPLTNALVPALKGQLVMVGSTAAQPEIPQNLISEQEAELRKKRAFANDW